VEVILEDEDSACLVMKCVLESHKRAFAITGGFLRIHSPDIKIGFGHGYISFIEVV
jgi:hypothetical protein